MTRKNSRIGDWLVQEGLLDPDTVEVIERERQRTRLRFSQAIRERFIDQKTALDALSLYRVPHHRPRHCDCTQICHPLDTVPYCDITPEYPSCYPRPSCHCSNRRSRKQTPTESNLVRLQTRGSSLRRIAQPNLRRSGISILFYRQYLARSACRRSASRDRRRTVAGP